MKKRDCPFTKKGDLPVFCTRFDVVCDKCQIWIDHENRRAHEVYESWQEQQRNINSGACPSPSED